MKRALASAVICVNTKRWQSSAYIWQACSLDVQSLPSHTDNNSSGERAQAQQALTR